MTTMTISIKCGNCKGTHGTVHEVRACYGVTPVASGTPSETVAQGRKHEASLPVAKPATDKQVAFMVTLTNERYPGSEITAEFIRTLPVAASSKAASAEIERLLAMPKPAKPATPAQAKPTATPEVPSGRYCIDHDGVVKFIKVDKVDEGKWAGRTFVKVQASDDLYPVKSPAVRAEMLAAVLAQGIQESMLRYGREIGSCGHCGRTLTNEDSRERGIGPVCASKMGW